MRDTPPLVIPVGSGARHIIGTAPGAHERTRWSVRQSTALVLDVLIAAYALGLVVILLTGGVDLGVVSLNEAAKPILILLIIVPLRITLGERSWLLEIARPLVHPRLAPVRAMALDRVSPAVVDVVFALAVTRAATFCIAFIANLLFTSDHARPLTMPFRSQRFAEIFAAWDSGWYFDIASRGYYFNADGQSSIAFFPLFPMLMRAVAWLFGGTDRAVWVAGIVVSCSAFALGLLAVHRLTQQLFGDREVARRAVLYLALFPFSLFFTRVYAESVFLLTSVLAVSRAYDGRWWRAGISGALATIARPNGILIGLPLALLALGGRPAAGVLAGRVAPLLLIPGALAGYCAYVYALSGDPLGWLSAQAHWGYSVGHPPWQQLIALIDQDHQVRVVRLLLRLGHGAVPPVPWSRRADLPRPHSGDFQTGRDRDGRLCARQPARSAQRQRARGRRTLRGGPLSSVHAPRQLQVASPPGGDRHHRVALPRVLCLPVRHRSPDLLNVPTYTTERDTLTTARLRRTKRMMGRWLRPGYGSAVA